VVKLSVGRYGGIFREFRAADLASMVIRSLLDRPAARHRPSAGVRR
jgi:hypothetical protein